MDLEILVSVIVAIITLASSIIDGFKKNSSQEPLNKGGENISVNSNNSRLFTPRVSDLKETGDIYIGEKINVIKGTSEKRKQKTDELNMENIASKKTDPNIKNNKLEEPCLNITKYLKSVYPIIQEIKFRRFGDPIVGGYQYVHSEVLEKAANKLDQLFLEVPTKYHRDKVKKICKKMVLFFDEKYLEWKQYSDIIHSDHPKLNLPNERDTRKKLQREYFALFEEIEEQIEKYVKIHHEE